MERNRENGSAVGASAKTLISGAASLVVKCERDEIELTEEVRMVTQLNLFVCRESIEWRKLQ